MPLRLRRRAPYWLVGAALLVVSVFAVVRTLQARDDQQRELERAEQEELARLGDIWESQILDRVAAWISDLPAETGLNERIDSRRSRTPWFDGFYVWRPSLEGPTFEWPRPYVPEDAPALFQHPCMRKAQTLAMDGARLAAVPAFRRCRGLQPPAQLLASSLAAGILLTDEQPGLALAALNEISVPLDLSLQAGISQGLSVQRLVIRRIQAARAHEAMGDQAAEQALLRDTVQEITKLDGPALQELLPTAEHVLAKEIADGNMAMLGLEAHLDRARRRIAGFREVDARLGSRTPQSFLDPNHSAPSTFGFDVSDHLQIVNDMYSDPGFILIYAPVDADRVAAVQLDAEELLNGIVETAPRSSRHPRLVILDANNNPVRGGPVAPPGVDGPKVWISVPLERIFPHLRLGLIKAPMEAEAEQRSTLFAQLLPVVAAFLLGLLAIAARMRADHSQRELYQRQQDFMARVTHELKTPLAGIRAMAEALDLGAADDPVKRGKFLARIVTEVERLTERIDQVLAVARTPTHADRRMVDPAVLAADLADEWTPRIEQVGGTLERKLASGLQVSADQELLRDALNNLLDNALKYRREDRPLHVQLVVQAARGQVEFRVVDNGLGVPPGQRRQVFERFARVEGPDRGMSGGHGLGLAFVAETARVHKGLVQCREGQDGGSCFVLRIKG